MKAFKLGKAAGREEVYEAIEQLRKEYSREELANYLKSIGEYHEAEIEYKGVPILTPQAETEGND